MPFEKKHELNKVKVTNRPEQSRESSRAKSHIVKNESRELTKTSRIVLGSNLSSRKLSRHPFINKAPSNQKFTTYNVNS